MSNMNSFAGLYNLPKFVISDTNEHALITPSLGNAPTGSSWSFPYYASGFASATNNIYAGYPSPQFPANSGLCVSFSPDSLGSDSVDGAPFKLKIAGVIANPGGGNLTVRQYQVRSSDLGIISTTGSVNSSGAPGSNDAVFSSIVFTAPADPSHFWMEYIMMWDSKTARLDGYSTGQVQATAIAQATTTALTSNVAAINALNFMPSFQFATGNAGNAVTVQGYSLERY